MTSPTLPKVPRKRRRRVNERGVALIIVTISIAVLVVVATEFAYNSQVDMQLAVNARDEVRAYYLARSGIGLSRLLIKFQKQIETSLPPGLGAMMGALTGAMGGGGADPLAALAGGLPGGLPGGPPAPAGNPGIDLLGMAQVNCEMMEALIPPEESIDPRQRKPAKAAKKFDFDDANPEVAAAQQQKKFGTFTGCFNAKITNENQRFNVSRLESQGAAALPQITLMIGKKETEFLYARPDFNVQATPGDIILALRDWMDEDEVQSSLNPNAVPPVDPFVKGFSDENSHYDRFQPRYKAKNARYDSLDELFMVHGVNDQFMAAFRDSLTVYPDPNTGLDINGIDPLMTAIAIQSVADPRRPDPRLQDPIFLDTVIQRIRMARPLPFMTLSVTDFLNAVAGAGVAVNPQYTNNVRNAPLADKATTFRVVSVGEAGRVKKTITTVIQADQGLGKLVYWREE